MIDLLVKCAPRERLLLGTLIFAVLPVALALGVLLPLHERRQQVAQAEAEARALFEWVAARVEDRQAFDLRPEHAPAAPIGSSGIEQGLIAAGLRETVSELGSRSGGVVDLRFDDVDFAALANWLSQQAPGWGYTIESFRFEALETPARVSARLTLRPQG